MIGASTRPVHGALAVFVAAMAALTACGGAHYDAKNTGAPSLVIPIYVAEGNTGKPPVDADAGVSGLAPNAAPPLALPDPEPLKTAHQWEFQLTYDKGNVRVDKASRVGLPHPAPTPRRVGRFAVELWVGRELLDRVRFDFPLLGSDAPPDKPGTLPRNATRFGPGAETHMRILVPDSERATAARLVDRLTGASRALVWPPESSAPDAGG